ncbi:unnamed protein product [Ostreobium quekettii]|uniref:Uncharacterized protein n=1 Tax=Ostreobium quekettii TaxID=121088 RepID=A0A8S1J137_9CHLO|nr:unnamed protein product [Ostreobium quekettii]
MWQKEQLICSDWCCLNAGLQTKHHKGRTVESSAEHPLCLAQAATLPPSEFTLSEVLAACVALVPSMQPVLQASTLQCQPTTATVVLDSVIDTTARVVGEGREALWQV